MKQIPSLGGVDGPVRRPLESIKESLDELRSVTSEKIKPLSDTATEADIRNKVNEILTRLQG